MTHATLATARCRAAKLRAPVSPPPVPLRPDLWILGAEPLLIIASAVALGCGALGFRHVVRKLEPKSTRRLGALWAAALIALIPLAAGVPGGRLLIVPSLASAALFTLAGRRAAHAFATGERRKSVAVLLWVALFGIGLQPLFRALVPLDLARVGEELPSVARAVRDQCGGRPALALGAADPNLAYVPVLLFARPPSEQHQVLHLVSMAPGAHRLRSLGGERFELDVEGDFFALPWARIYRDTPLPSGLARGLTGVNVQVLESSLQRTRLELSLPGGAASACWLRLEQGHLVSFAPPSGDTLTWTPSPR